MSLAGPEMKPPKINGVSGWMNFSDFGASIYLGVSTVYSCIITLGLLVCFARKGLQVFDKHLQKEIKHLI